MNEPDLERVLRITRARLRGTPRSCPLQFVQPVTLRWSRAASTCSFDRQAVVELTRLPVKERTVQRGSRHVL